MLFLAALGLAIIFGPMGVVLRRSRRPPEPGRRHGGERYRREEGIQPTIVQAIEDVIRDLAGRLTILLVEQDFDFACSVAGTCAVLARGRIVARGEGADMVADGVDRRLAL